MTKFLKEHWIESILLPAVAFILAIVWSMNSDLSKVDEKVNGVTDRVDRIANALPDLRVKVAYEELHRPPRTLLITSPPYKAGVNWASAVNVVDTTTGVNYVYAIVAPNREEGKFAVSGLVKNIDPDTNSFVHMEQYSIDSNQAKILPAGLVQKSASFVSYSSYSQITTALSNLGYKPEETTMVNAPTLDSWSATVDALTRGTLPIYRPTLGVRNPPAK